MAGSAPSYQPFMYVYVPINVYVPKICVRLYLFRCMSSLSVPFTRMPVVKSACWFWTYLLVSRQLTLGLIPWKAVTTAG